MKYINIKISSRINLVNCYIVVLSKASFIMQFFPMTKQSIAHINKQIGCFIWKDSILRTKRDNLYYSHANGGINLKQSRNSVAGFII